MKKLLLIIFVFASAIAAIAYYLLKEQTPQPTPIFTNIIIRNLSSQDSVKVFVTLPSTDSVMGLFGITDTISSSKGYFYARKDSAYASNRSTPLPGGVISFSGDNLPCQVAVPQGFIFGINIFEFSVNLNSECFDISCEDGCNSIIRSSVSDTLNWTTGEGTYTTNFRQTANSFPLEKNLNLNGVFPYRCTDCIDLGTAIPQNCFNLPDTCNTNRICQVARTANIGGIIYVDYISPALVPCLTK